EQTEPPERAIDTYAGLLAVDPTLMATPYFRTGFRRDHIDAIVDRAGQRVEELTGPGPAAEERRTALVVFAGRAAPAEGQLRAQLAADPETVDRLGARGRLLLSAGRTADAAPLLRAAVARKGDSAEARQALGDWYAATGDQAAARREWLRSAWLGDPRGLDAIGE